MKLFKKILLGLVGIILIAITAGYFYLRHISHVGLPDYSLDVSLSGIGEPVTVYRDQFAIPHIYARNADDLYRAAGFVMAQDRLWQMDLLRRVTTGRLAEILGPELVETDHLMRALRMSKKSKDILKHSEPIIIRALEAFADGVNQFIDSHSDKLPPEFTILGYSPEKWKPFHSVNLAGYMSWGLTMPWYSELLLHQIISKLDSDTSRINMLVPDLTLHKTVVYPGFPESAEEPPQFQLQTCLLTETRMLSDLGLTVFDSSNNWAVSGKKSVTGKPLFANDMHLGLSSPGIWYQMHQVIEPAAKPDLEKSEALNVTGVALPGQPFIVAGHNDHIAWGMTNVMLDDMDFYIETVNPDNPGQYQFNGKWKDFILRKEMINVSDASPVEKELRFTHRGPVISTFKGIEDTVISMRWTGNEPSNELRTIYLLNRAKNWVQFRDALRSFISISQNVAYADIHGNIGMQTTGGIPIREGTGYLTVPGDTDKYDWKGLMPFEDQPFSFNPDRGFVSSANNKTVNEAAPFYVSCWFEMPHRINRINEMLSQKEKLSIRDFQEMHSDVNAKHAIIFRDCFVKTIRQKNIFSSFNEVEKRAFNLLDRWDGRMDADSPAAAVFENLFLVLLETLARDEMGDELFQKFLGSKILTQNLMMSVLNHRNSPWCDDVSTPDVKETFTDWLITGFKSSIPRLQAQLGSRPSDWRWGKLHRLLIRHPLGRIKLLDLLFRLNRGPFPVGGSFHTVCPYSYSFKNPFDSSYGASHRHIYSTSDWDTSLSIIPTGISGIPSSSFYCDQTKLYTGNRYHPDFFSKSKVTQSHLYKMTITKRNSSKMTTTKK
jgi:penicillin G amidase